MNYVIGKGMIDVQQNLLDGLYKFMLNLSRDKFYGVLEIQFVDGQIVLVRKEESFKPVIFLR